MKKKKYKYRKYVFFDLPEVETSYFIKDYINIGENSFKCVGIIIHTGSSYSGHYTFYYRSKDISNGWIYFNDSVMEKNCDSKVEKILEGEIGKNVHVKCLWYEKLDEDDYVDIEPMEEDLEPISETTIKNNEE